MRSITLPSTARLYLRILSYGHELHVAQGGFVEFRHHRKFLGRVSKKRRRAAKIQKLIDQDTVTQRQREERLKAVEYVFQQSDLTTPLAPLTKTQSLPTNHSTTPHPQVQSAHLPSNHHRSQKYANGFIDVRPTPARSRTLVQ